MSVFSIPTQVPVRPEERVQIAVRQLSRRVADRPKSSLLSRCVVCFLDQRQVGEAQVAARRGTSSISARICVTLDAWPARESSSSAGRGPRRAHQQDHPSCPFPTYTRQFLSKSFEGHSRTHAETPWGAGQRAWRRVETSSEDDAHRGGWPLTEETMRSTPGRSRRAPLIIWARHSPCARGPVRGS